jgi:hypothetical protein
MTARYLSEALRGHAEDIRAGRACEYHAHALERIADEILRLNARDLIGNYSRPVQP